MNIGRQTSDLIIISSKNAATMKIDTISRQEQVRRYLIEYIRDNNLQPSDQLPSESDLARTIGVSRSTIREVFTTLEAEGILIRRHGFGTFLAGIPLVRESTASGFASYTSQIQSAGFTPHFKVLSVKYATVPDEALLLFNLDRSTELVCVERIILANETHTVYMLDYLHPEIVLRDKHWDQFDGNMIDFLSQHLGYDLAYLKINYEALLVDRAIASHLKLEEGMPIISSRSTLHSLDNHLIAYGISYLNPSAIKIEVTKTVNNRHK